MERLDGRTPAQLRPVTIEMGFQKKCRRQLSGLLWQYQGDLCGQRRKQCTAFFNREGERMADGGVCNAARQHAKQKAA